MRFLVDVDCVLADFVTPATRIVERVLGRPWSLAEAPPDQWDMFAGLTPGERKVVFTIINSPGFCRSLEPEPGSQAFISRLQELLDGNVYALTAHNDAPHWVFERDAWLGEHFNIDRGHTIHAHCKYVCSGDFYLDDRPDHIISWQREHPAGVGMVWSTDNNSRIRDHEGIRFGSWAEVIEVVERRLGEQPCD